MYESSQEVLNVAARARSATEKDIWKVLPLSLREAGILSSLRADEAGTFARQLRYALAAQLRGFRPSIIDGWDDTELSRRAARLSKVLPAVLEKTLVGYYLGHDPSIQAAFFDRLGIQHDNGSPVELLAPAAPASEVAAAANALLDETSWSSETIAYLLALSVMWSDQWPTLGEHLEQLVIPAPSKGEEPSVGESGPDDSPVQPRPADRAFAQTIPERLQAIDHAITGLIIRSLGGADGAPPKEAVSEIVLQFIRINPERKQSYFQKGLLDGLLGDPPAKRLPLENSPRRRWYSAGWVTALARIPDLKTVAERVRSDSPLFELGDGETATEYAAPSIAEALYIEERHAEAARFLTPRGVVACGFSFAAEKLLDWAASLLRSDRITEAKPYLLLLESAIRFASETGDDAFELLLPDVQRRLAHCARLEGDFERSRKLLEELLAQPLPDSYRAMALADLGLMECRFNRLSAINLPTDAPEAADLVRGISRGLARFEAVSAIDAPERSHGQYPLGLHRLFSGPSKLAGEALPLLESAAFAFESNPERYVVGGLIDRAQFATGIAGTLAPGAQLRAEHYGRLILQGYEKGLRLPDFLVADVILNLAFTHRPAAVTLVSKLIALGEERDLQLIESMEFDGVELLIARALLDSVSRNRKTTPQNAGRLRRALALAWKGVEQDRELALQILDRLYDLALVGVETEKFTNVLQDPTMVSGLWDPEEIAAARIHLLEQAGDHDGASVLLTSTFYRLLSDDSFGGLADAAELVERIRKYGVIPAGVIAPLEARLAAAQPSDEPTAPRSSDIVRRYAVSVAVVGGDDRQKQYEERLRAWARHDDVNVELHFIYSGWSSNWNCYVADFKRLMPKLEGLVLLRFTRTEFGRTIRGLWDKRPQIGTWGHGEQRIRLAIAEVAAMARERMVRETEASS